MKKYRSPFGCASRMTSGFSESHGGEDRVPVDGAPASNWNIYAVSGAKVYISKKQKGDYPGGYGAYGNYIVYICDNGFWVLCAHLAERPFVKAGERVSEGGLVGVAGATGNVTGRHLHIEVSDMRGVKYDGSTWYNRFKEHRVRPGEYIDFADCDGFTVKRWQNGSTHEKVYRTTADCKSRRDPVGSLAPYEACDCCGVFDGVYLVVYTVDGTDAKKCGFVGYAGGVG